MFQAKLEMQHCHCRHFSCPAWSRYLDRIVVGSNEIIPHHMSCNPRWNSKPAKRRFKVGMPRLMRGKLVFRSNLKWASRMSLHAGISNYPSPVSISAKRTDCRVSKWYDFSVEMTKQRHSVGHAAIFVLSKTVTMSGSMSLTHDEIPRVYTLRLELPSKPEWLN